MTSAKRHTTTGAQRQTRGLTARLDAVLFRRGFSHAGVRELVRTQTVICAGACLLGVMALAGLAAGAVSPDGADGIMARKVADFAAGTILTTFNFYGLAKFGQFLVYKRSGAVTGQLVRFYARLCVTGVVLYFLVIPGKADLLALFAGLTSIVATALAYAFNHAAFHSRGGNGAAGPDEPDRRGDSGGTSERGDSAEDGKGPGKTTPGTTSPGTVLKEAC